MVNTLLPRIEDTGTKACVDFRDFKAGRASLFNMQDAVRNSRHTLLVLTENWFGSEWTLFESVLSGTRDPAGLQQRTIPLQLRKSDVPKDADFIAGLTHVDFTRADREAIAWRQLLTALGKPPDPKPPREPERDEWFLAHPYPMPPNFTGRLAEREILTRWLRDDPAHPMLVVRALGGFGKSSLIWHWLTHDVSVVDWPRVVWWSFYEGEASFDRFLIETLEYLSREKIDWTKISTRDAINRLLQILHEPGSLLVLDGFERALRAFSGLDAAYQGDEEKRLARDNDHQGNDRDCVSPLAEFFLRRVALQPRLRSKVLITTRLRPRALEARGAGLLEGCREGELKQMQPADAVEFFRAQGIRGTHTEIETACVPYGFHPLSLSLLAGLILGDFQQPGDIAAAKRLDVSGDLIQSQHHVLETAYDSLTAARRALLSRIACFRSPVKYEALKALAESEPSAETQPLKPSQTSSQPVSATSAQLDSDLRDLIARGLLHHDASAVRFDLHPIVRRYAYDRLTASDRASAHTRLRNYFAAVPMADTVTRLEDLTPMIELYHHTLRAEQYDEAYNLFRDRIWKPLYYRLGGYQLQVELLVSLFPDGEDRPPRLEGTGKQCQAMSNLANSYGLIGQPRRAEPLYEQTNFMLETMQSEGNLAISLGNVAYMAQIHIGKLRAASDNLIRSITLSRNVNDQFTEAVGHAELGFLLACRGANDESESELLMAMSILSRTQNIQYQSVTFAYGAQRELFLLRLTDQSNRNPQTALERARQALELADETARTSFPYERDYVIAHWLLGSAYRYAGNFDESERHLHEALERCRRINIVDSEAHILIDLARLRAATGAPDEAQQAAEEALLITERSGYVLQGADAQLELARLALARDERSVAREHAQQAKNLATCDGPPDYTYKAAYDEAEELLKELGDN